MAKNEGSSRAILAQGILVPVATIKSINFISAGLLGADQVTPHVAATGMSTRMWILQEGRTDMLAVEWHPGIEVAQISKAGIRPVIVNRCSRTEHLLTSTPCKVKHISINQELRKIFRH